MSTMGGRSSPDEIVAWFVPTETPLGGAPDAIREQWVGTPLPIRLRNARRLGGVSIGANVDTLQPSIRPNAVPIEIGDAVLALTLCGQDEAAEWWHDFGAGLDSRVFAQTLSFRGEEGEVITQEEVEKNVPLAEFFEYQASQQAYY